MSTEHAVLRTFAKSGASAPQQLMQGLRKAENLITCARASRSCLGKFAHVYMALDIIVA